MRMRNRTGLLRAVAAVSVAGLIAAGVFHAIWASGIPWPRDNFDELADLVVGQRPFPSPTATWAVVVLISIGAWFVASGAALIPRGRVPWRLVILGTAGVGAVLALRGLGGLVTDLAELGDATDEFRHWDLLLYSPICIVLALGAAASVRLAVKQH